jgi:hypothetical protein
MLKFNAENWYYLAQRLRSLDILLSFSEKLEGERWTDIGPDLERVKADCNALYLSLSAMQADRAIKVWKAGNRKNCGEAIGELHRRIQDELSLNTFYWVPREKEAFLDQVFDVDGIAKVLPSIVDEVFGAGRCFMFGENTASIFHLMRVVDFGLRRVAKSLEIKYSAHTWKDIGDAIQGKMQQKYQVKTEEWKEKEPFYAGILTDIGAIGKAHRNPTSSWARNAGALEIVEIRYRAFSERYHRETPKPPETHFTVRGGYAGS